MNNPPAAPLHSFETYLSEHDTLTYTNVGVSMLPLLRQGKDLFTVRRKGTERACRGDVILYMTRPGRYLLHRVIAVQPHTYTVLGDNCCQKETGITDEQILGIMESFVRSGKTYRADAPCVRLYTWVMLHTASLRIFWKRLRRAARALYRQCRRKSL